LAFREVRAEILNSRTGRIRVELWVNALLNDGDDEGMLSDAAPSSVISLCRARLELTRHLVSLIDDRHRVLKRYPVLAVLAQSSGWEPEALGLAYLRHLRRDLEAVSAPRTGPKQDGGSAVTLSIVEGHSEGP
tara:strand:- start:201 stop:599 length:399 start_codon:yes stop_codon:yes gene_type:complete